MSIIGDAVSIRERLGIGVSDPEPTKGRLQILDLYQNSVDIRLLSHSDPYADFAYNGGDDNIFTFVHYGAELGKTIFCHVSQDLLTIQNDGNVGIGTSSPGSRLVISDGTNGVSILPGAVSGIGFNRNVADGAIYNSGISAWQFTARDAYFALEGYNGAQPYSWAVTKAGNVGIGTATPQAKLHVQGNIIATVDIILQNDDCAEEFTVKNCEVIEPGTVMVLDEEGSLRQSTEAYDKKVAGVVSGAGDLRPGLILGRHPEHPDRLPIALIGKVYCKVDTAYGSIEIGDLLTTSATPGHAMKASDPTRAFGAVIGKALGLLNQGQGLIPILIALQ